MAVGYYDILVRLQLGGCCVGNKLTNLTKDLMYGGECIDEKFIELSRLLKYLEILECYNVNNTINNCITETQLLKIFEDISTICNICFEPIGFSYLQQIGSNYTVPPVPPTNDPSDSKLRIIDDGTIRGLNTGDQRTYN